MWKKTKKVEQSKKGGGSLGPRIGGLNEACFLFSSYDFPLFSSLLAAFF
jgi:hypothetical protein